jgi:hypothetical protein
MSVYDGSECRASREKCVRSRRRSVGNERHLVSLHISAWGSVDCDASPNVVTKLGETGRVLSL